jgi:hypothetical protein
VYKARIHTLPRYASSVSNHFPRSLAVPISFKGVLFDASTLKQLTHQNSKINIHKINQHSHCRSSSTLPFFPLPECMCGAVVFENTCISVQTFLTSNVFTHQHCPGTISTHVATSHDNMRSLLTRATTHAGDTLTITEAPPGGTIVLHPLAAVVVATAACNHTSRIVNCPPPAGTPSL